MNETPRPTLVTGSAGFIGSHVALCLLERGEHVVGFDNLNHYCDPALKRARLARLAAHPGYVHVEADLADRSAVESLFAVHQPARVAHLAAQAGVRYAAENPHVYVSSNVTGFLHVLEGCRRHPVEHLVYASTSSVYVADTAADVHDLVRDVGYQPKVPVEEGVPRLPGIGSCTESEPWIGLGEVLVVRRLRSERGSGSPIGAGCCVA